MVSCLPAGKQQSVPSRAPGLHDRQGVVHVRLPGLRPPVPQARSHGGGLCGQLRFTRTSSYLVFQLVTGVVLVSRRIAGSGIMLFVLVTCMYAKRLIWWMENIAERVLCACWWKSNIAENVCFFNLLNIFLSK